MIAVWTATMRGRRGWRRRRRSKHRLKHDNMSMSAAMMTFGWALVGGQFQWFVDGVLMRDVPVTSGAWRLDEDGTLR